MFEKILICLDGSKAAEQVLPYATEQALRFDSEVMLVRVIDLPGTYIPLNFPGEPGFPIQIPPSISHTRSEETEATAYLSEILSSLREKGLRADFAVIPGRPGEAIVQYAQDNDFKLIAIGTHGHGGLRQAVLGSTADYVLRYSVIPVLMVRPT